MKQTTISPRFIELAPKELEEGILYISQKYKTALHKCCCGCGEKVVTPLSPAHWQVRSSRGEISLHPSIGNWGMTCQSHYWIRDGKVIWASAMSKEQIATIRKRDQIDQAEYQTRTNQEKGIKISSGGWLNRLLRFILEVIGK